MLPKNGLPKRKALKRMPCYRYGHHQHPYVAQLRQQLPKPTKRFTVVSMFSGCGGFDLGLEGGFAVLGRVFDFLPFSILAAYDIEPHACATYQLNLGDVIQQVDLTQLDEKEIVSADLLVGGFPCQDFSTCGTKLGLQGERGRLYRVMCRYMQFHRPKVVIAENVPGFLTLNQGKIAQEVVAEFDEMGYETKIWSLYCPDLGLPQSRTRLFLVSVRHDLLQFGRPLPPEPTHLFTPITIKQALADLEEVVDETVPNQSQYFVSTKATKGGGQGDQVSVADGLAFAVRANPKGRVHFHYQCDRRLTVRELARLQSFPDQFVFPHSMSKNIMEIGNAVPPLIGYAVGSTIAQFLEGL